MGESVSVVVLLISISIVIAMIFLLKGISYVMKHILKNSKKQPVKVGDILIENFNNLDNTPIETWVYKTVVEVIRDENDGYSIRYYKSDSCGVPVGSAETFAVEYEMGDWVKVGHLTEGTICKNWMYEKEK